MTRSIWVPGEPVPQPRERSRSNIPSTAAISSAWSRCYNAAVFRDWLVKNSRASTYTPADHPVNAWKQAIRSAWVARFCDLGRMIEFGAIGMSLTFVRKRPKTMSINGKTKTITFKRKPNPRLWDHANVGDPDNLEKSVMDALSGVAYKDDCQIACNPTERFVARPDEETGVLIEIWGLDPLEAERREIRRPKFDDEAPF